MDARISRGLAERLLALAAASPDAEICGLLLGEGDTIVEIVPAANVADDPATRFEIDPAALFAARRAERAGERAVIGHYHSHPKGPAAPSACDAALAHEPGRLWLILGEGGLAAWRAVPGGSVHGAFEPVWLGIGC